MSIALKSARCLILALTVLALGSSLGCHAQAGSSAAASGTGAAVTPGATDLSPDEARRVEVLIRQRANVPPEYSIQISPRAPGELPGYDALTVVFSSDGKQSKPLTFLLSKDGKTLAQFTKFDISQDPKLLVSGAGRPSRGGPASAPVLIVGFDDLECPYCAKMNAQLFPALLERYKDQIHIVYRDFPLDQHPWAMRAAIDVNCVGAQSTEGYWNLVDSIHAHAGDIGAPEKTVAKANEALDKMARDEGARQKVKLDVLNACLAKQDESAVKASMQEGEKLGVQATPALFINGEKLEGAVPMEFVYKMIDGALVAAGQKPPAPTAVENKPAAAAAKSGN